MAPRGLYSRRTKNVELKMEEKMKKVAMLTVMFIMAIGAKAQDCEVLVLPYFNNDRAAMENYQEVAPYKFEWRCAYARAAFYEADNVPEGADVFQISEVKNKFTVSSLPSNYVVDLSSLSYYAYNFVDFQLKYPTGDKTLCFATPGSTHPYLVLRSISDMHSVTNQMIDNRE